MKIVEENKGHVTVVEVNGRIDSNTAKPFGARLIALLKSGQAAILVDLEHIVYISSAGFRELLLAGRLADQMNSRLALCSLNAEVQRLFDIGAFTDLFSIYSSREEGMQKVVS